MFGPSPVGSRAFKNHRTLYASDCVARQFGLVIVVVVVVVVVVVGLVGPGICFQPARSRAMDFFKS